MPCRDTNRNHAVKIKLVAKKPKPIILTWEKFNGDFRTTFKIHNQKFALTIVGTEKEARWYCRMLKIAYKRIGITSRITKPKFND